MSYPHLVCTDYNKGFTGQDQIALDTGLVELLYESKYRSPNYDVVSDINQEYVATITKKYIDALANVNYQTVGFKENPPILTPLTAALLSGHIRSAKLLIDAGANLKKANELFKSGLECISLQGSR